MSNKPIRHGEVVLLPVDGLPEGKKCKTVKRFIVGHSETGHHHVLESKKEYKVLEWGEDSVFLQLFEEGTLVHQKDVNRHNDLNVAPGTYRTIRKKEYDPFEKVMREVWD